MRTAIAALFLLALSCGGQNEDTPPSECFCSADLCGCPAESCQCIAPVCDCPVLPVRAVGSVKEDGTLIGLSGTFPVTSVQRLSVGRYWIGVDADAATVVQLTPRCKTVISDYNLFADGILIELVDLSGANVDCEFSFSIEQAAQMVP